MIYAILALFSIVAAAGTIVLMIKVAEVIEESRDRNNNHGIIRSVNLSSMRYWSLSKRNFTESTIRSAPHGGPEPSPVFDGTFRRPWGW